MQTYSQAFGLPGVVLLDVTSTTNDPQSYAGFLVIAECEIGSFVSPEHLESAGTVDGGPGEAQAAHWLVGKTLPVGFQFWCPFQSMTVLSGTVAMYRQDRTFKGSNYKR